METGRNLLGDATSPYLLQHAGNPVHWRPWGAEALAEAKSRDCPILLSVGYAACHWCHVMAHESFENADTANRMNELYVNVKVDREERPDIDHIYMTALHAMGEQGGWPMTMFLDPEGRPIYGGTYWPPEPRWGRPSFRQMLELVADAWRTRRPKMEENGAALADHLARLSAPSPGRALTPDDLTKVGTACSARLTRSMAASAARLNSPTRRSSASSGTRCSAGRDPKFGEAVRALLAAMNAGGIYDHLGGGYARYSTDAEWLVPHFEKMLYDNAQILELLALVHARWPDPVFAERARETVGWIRREMRVAEAFAASLDADQDGEEGAFYVWREEQIDAALGEASPPFKAAYDVTASRKLGGPHRAQAGRRAGLGRERARARRSARDAVRAARAAAKAGARRQGPRRLERPHDRRAGAASAVFGEPDGSPIARGAYYLRLERFSMTDDDRSFMHGAMRVPAPWDFSTTMRPLRAPRSRLFEGSGDPGELETARQFAGGRARPVRRRRRRRLSHRLRLTRRAGREAPPCA